MVWFCITLLSHNAETQKITDGVLIEKEEIAHGAVSSKVYLYYLKNAGWGLVTFVVFAQILQASLMVTNNFWLSRWSEAGLFNEVSPVDIL